MFTATDFDTDLTPASLPERRSGGRLYVPGRDLF